MNGVKGDACAVVLNDVLMTELQELQSFSQELWRIAYEPDVLAEPESTLLWEMSYSLSAMKTAIVRGERLRWICIGGQRAGFVSTRWDASQRVMRLSKLYLSPNYWGKGLGSWVLGLVKAMAYHAGATRIELYVFRANTRAVNAYLRAGYRIERAELTDNGNGTKYDDYLMCQDL